ncbi:hypothetical protein ACFS5N_11855 [Mucilaginibacter ximonensis]|uniref:Uncharacterized protein n=1 Tax=Mucilaginibacter ximonensis TaxID=538021 RepID=A0ABW5YDT7_9SPHI
MKADKDEKLKALLKQAGSDKPAERFTDSVMQIIEADAAREAALRSVLKQHFAEGPSFDFTANVMRGLNTQRKPVVIKPVISKRAWYAIWAVLAVMLIVAFLAGGTNQQAVVDNSEISHLVNQLQTVSPTVVLAFVLAAILLLGDYWFSERRKAVVN